MDIGSKVFVDGCVGEIVGQNGKDHWVVKIDQILVLELPCGMQLFQESNTCYTVAKSKVKELCTESFLVGDHVESSYRGSNGFTGRVTGFELAENRVVCVSDHVGKYKNDRTRFAYQVDEIRKIDDTVVFALNHKYKDHLGRIYRTIECPREEKFMLINDASGTFICYVKPETKQTYLDQYALYHLEDTSKANYKG